MQRRSRGGFTLVEVLVALVVSGMVLVGARGLLDAFGAQAAAVLRRARAADSQANADDLLRRALADLVVSSDTLPSLQGSESTFSFQTSCDTPHGWRERCATLVAIEPTKGGYQLVIREDKQGAVVLRHGLVRAGLRYLLTVSDGVVWTTRWENTVMLPLAIGVTADDEVSVFRIGERR